MVTVQSLWDDRLAEVWANPGRAGAGVVVGTHGVLTARHVVAEALGAPSGRVLSRVVRAGSVAGKWVTMRVAWDAPEWDIALLAVEEESQGAAEWLAPRSPRVVVVALGSASEPGCEAVGFPQSEVQKRMEPSERVRQTEQAVGRVLPIGQGKRPISPERELPLAWMPLDIDTATPETQADWGGMSGAGVALPDGRLVGVVVNAEDAHQQRRLYLVGLAAVLEQADGFRGELSRLAGRDEVAEARDAPSYRAALRESSLGPDGIPRRVGELSKFEELSVFGVKSADLPGEPTYLDYVPRDSDEGLREALQEAIARRLMLMVVGASASGKSRSASRAAADLFPERRLVVPQNGKLAETVELPLATLAEAVVWLDDAENYAHAGLRDTLETLVRKGAVVVGTIRKNELDGLTLGELRNPGGEALTDPHIVSRLDWRLGWNEDERARLSAVAKYRPLLDAVARGMPVGVYCVAGPELVQKLRDALNDEERPARYPLVRTVLDWFRTGTTDPIPLDVATALMATLDTIVGGFEREEVQEALEWATAAVPGFDAGRRTSQSLLSLDADAGVLTAHDYLRDEDTNQQRVPEDYVWAAALKQATLDSYWGIGYAALRARKPTFALRATIPLAESGDPSAMSNLGLLLEESDPPAARRWYEQAAEAGDTGAKYNLGRLLSESDPVTARHWFEDAASAGSRDAMVAVGLLLAQSDPVDATRWFEKAAKAGSRDAKNALGALLAESNPVAARRWLEQAAEAGHPSAMHNLGILLAERDPVVARRWFERAASVGNSDAMVFLGVLLEESDPAAAKRWLEHAAKAGNADGMNNLGVLLLESDPVAARRWFEQAAEAGNADGMNNLGAVLEQTDLLMARHWYLQAVAADHREAMDNLRRLLQKTDPGPARRWFEQLAEAGNSHARYNLGVLLAETEPAAARRWFELAAEAGHSDAMNNLGVLLEEIDPLGARRWYEQAAEAGNSRAKYNLGVLLAETEPAAARRWFEQAAEAGDSDAMNNLGVLLVEIDPLGARRWYEQAAEAGNSVAMSNLGELLGESDPDAASRWRELAVAATATGGFIYARGIRPGAIHPGKDRVFQAGPPPARRTV
jgi:TPR repeat protein